MFRLNLYLCAVKRFHGRTVYEFFTLRNLEEYSDSVTSSKTGNSFLATNSSSTNLTKSMIIIFSISVDQHSHLLPEVDTQFPFGRAKVINNSLSRTVRVLQNGSHPLSVHFHRYQNRERRSRQCFLQNERVVFLLRPLLGL